MNITDQMRQELNHRLALLTAIVREKQVMEKRIQETLKNAQEIFQQQKTNGRNELHLTWNVY
jgi:hypothetical protein